jgi:predicted N-acyltransferase
MLQFVDNVDQIIENIKTMQQYLDSDIAEEKAFARELVKKGRSMLIYKVNGQNHFGPIRFLGFKNNSKSAHIENENREVRDASHAIQLVMGKPFTHAAIEKEFNSYADTFKGPTLKSKRKYWRVRNGENKYFELSSKVAEAEVNS